MSYWPPQELKVDEENFGLNEIGVTYVKPVALSEMSQNDVDTKSQIIKIQGNDLTNHDILANFEGSNTLDLKEKI